MGIDSNRSSGDARHTRRHIAPQSTQLHVTRLSVDFRRPKRGQRLDESNGSALKLNASRNASGTSGELWWVGGAIRTRRSGSTLVADNIAAVVSLTQMGIVEDHTWNPTDDDVERPNRFVWDSTQAPRWPGKMSSPLPRSCAPC